MTHIEMSALCGAAAKKIGEPCLVMVVKILSAKAVGEDIEISCDSGLATRFNGEMLQAAATFAQARATLDEWQEKVRKDTGMGPEFGRLVTQLAMDIRSGRVKSGDSSRVIRDTDKGDRHAVDGDDL